jgi:hypothetical protein
MKKLIRSFIWLFIIGFSSSCSKSNSENDKTVRITVQEYKTNLTIGAALVEYYKPCPSCAFQPGFNLVFSARTDRDGHVEVPEKVFNNYENGILITPPSMPLDVEYWGTGYAGQHSTDSIYVLPVVGEEKFHFVKTTNSPKGYYVEFFEEGELASFQKIGIARVYGFPADSSFSFYSYRGQTCKITWNIYDSSEAVISSGGPVAIDIPRTGIQELQINY